MSTLSSLYDQLRDAKDNLRTYKKRLSQLEDIISNLGSKFSDDIEDINSDRDSLIEKSEDGFESLVHIVDLDARIKNDTEVSVSEDADLSSASTYLNSDKKNTQDMIDSINSQITSLEAQIEAEEERQRKEREERAKQALEKLKNIFS